MSALHDVVRPAATPGSLQSVRDSLVVLAGVDVDVGGVPVLRGINLQVRAGEVVGLAGPNGSGKSTLLRAVATLLRPVRGSGRVLGADVCTALAAAVRPSIVLVGHDAALYPRLSLVENLGLVARLTGHSRDEAIGALDAVGLGGAKDRRAGQCSHGMVRRAELARVLLCRPRLLLLDEAHTGLDEASSGLVGAVVDRVRARGGSTILVSHDHRRLTDLVDRVICIADGQLVRGGPVSP